MKYSIQDAFEKIEAFYHGGGNFQSVSNYLTSHIDVTLERHGLEYIPRGETSGFRKCGKQNQR